MRTLLILSGAVSCALASSASAISVYMVDDTSGAPLDVGDTFTLEVRIDTSPYALISAQMFLNASIPGVLQANSLAYNAPPWDGGTGPTDLGISFPTPQVLDPLSSEFGTGDPTFAGIAGDVGLATFEMEVIAIPPGASSVDLAYGPLGSLGINDFPWDLWPGAQPSVTQLFGTTVNLVPEPASALLLLAGVPWVWRRT